MNHRKEKALNIMKDKQIDILVLTAGENLRYITNNKFSESERLLLYFLQRDGTGVYIIPEVEKLKVNLYDTKIILSYKDDESPNNCFNKLKDMLYISKDIVIVSNKICL